MGKTRTLQRAPNLGLTLKMAKPDGPGCVPVIGPARWWNPATGDYDLETLVVNAGYWDEFVSVGAIINPPLVARVTGSLCACAVEWSHAFVNTGAPDIFLNVATPDRALAVSLYRAPLRDINGVLTATPTVIYGSERKTLAPIYLVIDAGVYC